MNHPPGELTRIQICRAQSDLRTKVDGMLRRSGLEIRELAHALAICNPSDREKGRIHIPYTTGDVSHRLITWNFLGPLRGYEPDDPDHESGVDAAAIIAILTGKTPPLAI